MESRTHTKFGLFTRCIHTEFDDNWLKCFIVIVLEENIQINDLQLKQKMKHIRLSK